MKFSIASIVILFSAALVHADPPTIEGYDCKNSKDGSLSHVTVVTNEAGTYSTMTFTINDIDRSRARGLEFKEITAGPELELQNNSALYNYDCNKTGLPVNTSVKATITVLSGMDGLSTVQISETPGGIRRAEKAHFRQVEAYNGPWENERD